MIRLGTSQQPQERKQQKIGPSKNSEIVQTTKKKTVTVKNLNVVVINLAMKVKQLEDIVKGANSLSEV